MDSPYWDIGVLASSGIVYYYGLSLFLAWISNYIHHKVWREITYTFLNFNGATVEVIEWLSNLISHLTRHMITYSYCLS